MLEKEHPAFGRTIGLSTMSARGSGDYEAVELAEMRSLRGSVLPEPGGLGAQRGSGVQDRLP